MAKRNHYLEAGLYSRITALRIDEARDEFGRLEFSHVIVETVEGTFGRSINHGETPANVVEKLMARGYTDDHCAPIFA